MVTAHPVPRCLAPHLRFGDLNTHLLGNEERKIIKASEGEHRASHTRPHQSTLPLTSGTSGQS